MRKHTSWLAVCVLALAPALAVTPAPLEAQGDPVVQKIIELGTTDNQVMKWADYATNRFGGRITGSDAYNNASDWAVWQFEQWGLDAHLDPVGEVPVGFNRGPWFGRVMAPTEHALYFGTPSFTAGTKGLQRGRAVILETDPFSVPSRNPSAEDIEAKREAVAAAVAEVNADPSRFDGAWVLIAGMNSGFARDGRRDTPEYSDSWLMPPLTQALLDAGAFGTVQKSGDPIRILDGFASSWEELPELPDIKLVETHYDEIRALVEAGTPVELEFDIRNWFKMGPVKYDNVVAVIRGTTYPDEYVVLGSHFDSFDGSTGAVDAVSGVSPHMEAVRLIAAAGGAPKRSIAIILFAAEEIGLVGSQNWLADHPEAQPNIVAMVNRDGSPSAITGVSVPSAWHEDFQRITAPLTDLSSRWPFELQENHYPGLKPTSPGGSDHSSFAMLGIPILGFRTQSDYSYGRAWHTLYDIYSELVPYTDHQKHTAVVTAVVAYGIANLDQPLTRDGVYLPDGLFADITTASGARVIATLDYENAPLQTANFIRIIEGNEGQAAGGGRRFGRQAATPAIGSVAEVGGGVVSAVIDSEAQRSAAVANLPLTENPAVKHDGPGVLGVSGPNTFYLTLDAQPSLDGRYTALGKVIAGAHTLGDIAAGDGIQRVRILRSGEAALAFATDDDAFHQLMRRTPQQ
jgi:cyclophilin family peptidyl-prolyl cis-trans isomerase